MARFNVTDDEPWLPPLLATVRAAFSARIPLVGVCFGHQLIALALGGEVGPALPFNFCVDAVLPVGEADAGAEEAGGWAWSQLQVTAAEWAPPSRKTTVARAHSPVLQL